MSGLVRLFVTLVFVVVIATSVVMQVMTLWSVEQIPSIKISGVDRVVVGSGENLSSKYLVFTETETFENTDSLLFGKFNSSDFQGMFMRSTECTSVKVTGWRIPWFSMYRNIIEATCS